ncbi:hypothetical protein HII31_01265 [Pseudocercospora fuligena]|uniref:Uncharacterized protein n=1 Tax=Pseudocercospora fuligena TaxID=685502 RepID=A0A8H6VMP3_9PEZI|nr:hypothetical protein HII31_01265 [Pseudocercospora fuligena]
MPTKTPGGVGGSEKFQKQQAEKEGLGAENAPGRTEGLDKNPGSAKVASDSGSTNVGVAVSANNPGEKGISGVPVDSKPEGNTQNMK